MKILIFTDSRGQHKPRGQDHDMFGDMLKKTSDFDVEMILCPMKWTTTLDFLEYIESREKQYYDKIILQTGIVDWSPRPQSNAINDLYNRREELNVENISLNTRDYNKKIVNNKKKLFDRLFTEERIVSHLNNPFGTIFEGEDTINMYSERMLEDCLLPKLMDIENLIFINSNIFVPGWEGDFKRGRPANIKLTENYSRIMRDALGPERVVDLLRWSEEETQLYTCDNIHLTKSGNEYIYADIMKKLHVRKLVNGRSLDPLLSYGKKVNVNKSAMKRSEEMSTDKSIQSITDIAALFSSDNKRPIETPEIINASKREKILYSVGKSSKDVLATLIIGVRIEGIGDKRHDNLFRLLNWIAHFYGSLFDVLIVEQDEAPRLNEKDFVKYENVRYRFLYNPMAYNRGWGYNVAVRHYTKEEIVACLDTDVLVGRNFVREIMDCFSRFDVISPYLNVYYSDEEEAEKIVAEYELLHARDESKVFRPTTICGGIVIFKRNVFERLAGFEQYTEYAGEDRALDVTILNHCDKERIRIAPYTYVHLYHPPAHRNKSKSQELLKHLRHSYGCTYDPVLGKNDFIHESCSHVPEIVTLSNLIQRRKTYGLVDLYSCGKPLTINGLFVEDEEEKNDNSEVSRVENRDLANYRTKELYKAADPDREEISAFFNAYKGKRCFIIGNGPSLNKHDLSLLENEYTFGVNSIYYKTRETGFVPTFFVVEDNAVMKENIEEIRNYEAPFKFFPTIYRSLHPKTQNTFFFRMNRGFYEISSPNYCIPRFSTDASEVLYCGQSVTYINLQLAFFMGFEEVYLIGMDFDYEIPPEHGRRGDLIISTTDDPNHFHKDYFGKGKTWKDPKLDRVGLNYRQAKLSYEAAGRKIYNATIGGKLEIFDRADYGMLFEGGASEKASIGRSSLVDCSDEVVEDCVGPAAARFERPSVTSRSDRNTDKFPTATASKNEEAFPTFSLIIGALNFGRLWISKRILGWGGVWLLSFAGLVAGYFMYPELRFPWGAVAASVFAGWSVLFLAVAHAQYLGNRNRRERRIAINDLRETVKGQQRDIDRLSRALDKAKGEIADLVKGDDAKQVVSDLSRQIELSRLGSEDFARKRIDAAVEELKRRIAEVEGRDLEDDFEKIAAELSERIDLVEGRFAEVADMKIEASLKGLESRIAEIERTDITARFESDLTELRQRIAEAGKNAAESAIARVEEIAGDLRKRISTSSAQSMESVKMLNDAFERLDAVVKREVEYMNRSMQLALGGGDAGKATDPALGPDGWVKRAIDKTDAELNKATKRLDEQIAMVAKDIKSNADVQNRRFSLLSGANSASTNGHLRYLNDTDIKRIMEFWIPTFGLSRNRKALSYIANKICNVEQACDGRLATTIQAAMLRTLALRSIGKRSIEVLEIGTLFGIGAAALYKTAEFGTRVSLTLIDPLEGYYNAGADPATGLPVNRDVLEGNLSALSIPESDYRIIQHYSDSEEAIEKAGDRSYDFVLIDGDHSLAGVTRDFELYGDMVRPGGLLVFDDYDTTDWPAIKPFVDDVVRADERWQWIGGEWRTGILRRVSYSQDREAEPRTADGPLDGRTGKSRKAR
ncbi:DUF115 domain-containing protein [Stappia sp. F7233]|uniref:DUF115 domain-containing protein n=1 Tax=Stappia albiluteola TaxID=2758565 RepID=A0A839AEP2_9HYPH|nr:6-hydroxymethylpterin diphosphokinase MptE-like protein [Stappia albiluteola]MBA5778051.1 DUF115 domain-containing protein [Stappia albiluteola]